jgi:hypothetical protein
MGGKRASKRKNSTMKWPSKRVRKGSTASAASHRASSPASSQQETRAIEISSEDESEDEETEMSESGRFLLNVVTHSCR